MNDWEKYLEWESIDMVVQKSSINESISKTLEERKKVEEADNQLTNELFDNEPKKQSIKEKSMIVINKIKSSGIKVVDSVIIKTTNRNEDKKRVNKNEKRKIYDEYTLNNLEEKSINIEDKYFFNKSMN